MGASFRWARWAMPMLAATAAGQAEPTAQSAEPADPPVTQGPPEAAGVEPPPAPSKNILGLDAATLTEPLVTDRPDFTESTDAVPYGHFQIEGGYTFTYDREGRERRRDHTAAELLLRVGVVRDFELRVGWEGYSWSNETFPRETRAGRTVIEEDWVQGAHDLSLGFKYKFWEQDGLLPHFGVITAMNVPTGSANTAPGDVEPETVFLWAYDLTDRLALAGNVGLAVPTDAGRRFLQTSASVSLAAALTDRLGSYIEYFGFYPNGKDAASAHTLNGGLTYLITDNLQVDLRAGFGLNDEADDFFTGVGFAWRW